VAAKTLRVIVRGVKKFLPELPVTTWLEDGV